MVNGLVCTATTKRVIFVRDRKNYPTAVCACSVTVRVKCTSVGVVEECWTVLAKSEGHAQDGNQQREAMGKTAMDNSA